MTTTLRFAAGESVKRQAITIAAVDNAVEELEYFRADLSNLAGTNAANGQIDANRKLCKNIHCGPLL